MPRVEMTSHLYRYFPQLEAQTMTVPAGSIAEVLQAVNQKAPGFSDYILDDHGAVRRHVHLAINDNLVIDRKTLSDYVDEDATVYIFQALTGG
jgi:sulfur carrier protein ThiS